jgi:hypothetical protein
VAFVLLFSFVAALTASAGAGPHTSTLTGSPATGREFFSATALPNGQVLVAGGQEDNVGPLATAELYDPATGTWTPTGSMANVRYYHAAVLLPNGKVLVAGGATQSQTATAELYDPATGLWAPTGSLHQARNLFTLTLLADGRVLAAAGFASDGFVGPIATAEIYDPATEQWTPTGALLQARHSHTATLLPDGRVLVVAGAGGVNASYQATAELYDPVSGSWTAAGVLADAPPGTLTEHTATLLQNGTVLVAGGGVDGWWISPAMELYDPATGQWTATATRLVANRASHTATLLPNGDVLLAGGRQFDYAEAGVEIYHPATGACTGFGFLSGTRYGHTATLLADGQVLMTGGRGALLTVKTAELVDPRRGTWALTGDLSSARYHHVAVRLADGRVLIAGGWDGTQHLTATADLYNPVTARWTPTGSMANIRWLGRTTLLADGRVLLSGGENNTGRLDSAELYDPVTGTWRTTARLSIGRSGHTATVLADGKVLVAGGYGLSSAELYDPATEQWTPTGDLTTVRCDHTAILLPSGQVLVVGGDELGSAELYDPIRGTWTATSPAPGSPSFKSGFLLPSGKVFTFGGPLSFFSNGVYDKTGALYDPASATWTPTGSFHMPTSYFAAAQLTDGQVILAGGLDAGAIPATELYDPASGSWRPTGSLNTARLYHTITPLLDGRLLVAGGIGPFNAVLASAEIYDPGFGLPAAAQPKIIGVTATRRLGDPLALAGTGLLGTGTEFPRVQVRSLSNGQAIFLQPATGFLPSATAFASEPITGLLPGLAEVMLIAQGVTSSSVIVRIDAGLPSVTTLSATNPTLAGAALNAEVTASWAATQVHFAYSTDPALVQNVSTSPTIALAANADHAPVSQTVAGLAPHTTYYYRAVAINSMGTASGAILSFTTGNTAPIAPDATALGTTGGTRTITLDFPATDADGDALTLTTADGDAHLTVTGFTGREVSFTIGAHFAGTAAITYQVSDGLASATGQITVTIPDEAPVLTLAGANPLVLAYAAAFVEPGATAVDAVDGDLSVNATGAVDSATAGDYTITYSVTDSAGHTVTAARIVTVSPSPAPVARADRYFTAGASRAPLILHVLDNDTANVPASLTIVSVTTPSLGTAAISGDGRTITYTPRVVFASAAASDLFSYTIRDGFGGTATAQVTIGNSARQLHGVYDGLLSDGTNTVGFLRLALTATGTWTGTLQLGTVSTSIRARFDLENSARVTTGGQLLTLQFARTGEPVIAVTLGAGTVGTLTRAPFNATTHRSPKAGRYSVLLPAPAAGVLPPDTLPGGAGYAAMVISPSGLALLAGRCGDGTLWSAKCFLKEDDTMALYVIVRYQPGRAGTLAGLVSFRELAGVSDCDGALAWFKPPQTSPAKYPARFTASIPALGCRYVAPVAKQALVFTNLTRGAAQLTVAGADLVAPITDTIAVFRNNTVIETSTPGDHLVLVINPATGLFSGSLLAPFQLSTEIRTARGLLRGVLLQKQNLAAGQFLGPVRSGKVQMAPQ